MQKIYLVETKKFFVLELMICSEHELINYESDGNMSICETDESEDEMDETDEEVDETVEMINSCYYVTTSVS